MSYKTGTVDDAVWKQNPSHALSAAPGAFCGVGTRPGERSRLEIFLRQSDSSPNAGGSLFSCSLSVARFSLWIHKADR